MIPEPILLAFADGPNADAASWARGLGAVAVAAIVPLAPAAVLMVTAYVRISIVLNLLRQALGNPQAPGNQILAMLSLLLTAAVMKPVADQVYQSGIRPYAEGRATIEQAWTSGSAPVKTFMVRQIAAAHNERYLLELREYVEPPGPNRPEPEYLDELPMQVVAPAFLLSELNVAMMIGFAIYLPFLAIDLVTAAVLSAMGLYLLPPSQVALPLKLVAFALAEGWWLVSDMLLRSFAL